MTKPAKLFIPGPVEVSQKTFAAMKAGQPEKQMNTDEINADLARLPDQPDETLR